MDALIGGVACVTSSRTHVFTCVATSLLLTAFGSSGVPFHVVQPLSVDDLQTLISGFVQLDGFRHLQLLNVRKLFQQTLIHFLCVEQGSTVGSVIFLSQPMTAESTVRGRRASQPKQPSCAHPH